MSKCLIVHLLRNFLLCWCTKVVFSLLTSFLFCRNYSRYRCKRSMLLTLSSSFSAFSFVSLTKLPNTRPYASLFSWGPFSSSDAKSGSTWFYAISVPFCTFNFFCLSLLGCGPAARSLDLILITSRGSPFYFLSFLIASTRLGSAASPKESLPVNVLNDYNLLFGASMLSTSD